MYQIINIKNVTLSSKYYNNERLQNMWGAVTLLSSIISYLINNKYVIIYIIVIILVNYVTFLV